MSLSLTLTLSLTLILTLTLNLTLTLPLTLTLTLTVPLLWQELGFAPLLCGLWGDAGWDQVGPRAGPD